MQDFYSLRSKVVHGSELAKSDVFRGHVDHLKIALGVFEQCVLGMLVQRIVQRIEARAPSYEK